MKANKLPTDLMLKMDLRAGFKALTPQQIEHLFLFGNYLDQIEAYWGCDYLLATGDPLYKPVLKFPILLDLIVISSFEKLRLLRPNIIYCIIRIIDTCDIEPEYLRKNGVF